jgi:hypothetical protein
VEDRSLFSERHSLIVNNVAPTASVSGPIEGLPGELLSFTLDAFDPSLDDRSAGFTFDIDWDGDGTHRG